MNYQQIFDQTVTYKGHILKFIDFVHRFKTKKDVITGDNIVLCPRTNRYILLLDKHKNLKFFWSWNWAAFFTGTVPWLIYRRMFTHAVLLILFTFIPFYLFPYGLKFIMGFGEVLTSAGFLILWGCVMAIYALFIIACCFMLPAVTNHMYFSKIAGDIIAAKPVPKSNTILAITIIATVIVNSISWFL